MISDDDLSKMLKTDKKEYVSKTLYMDKKLLQKLEKLAKQQKTSVSKVINKLLESMFD